MLRERLSSWFWGTVLAFGLGCGIAGCLATAFEFTLTEQFWITMALVCPLLSGLCSFRFGELGCLVLLAGSGVYLWQRSSLSAQLDALVYTITRCYRSGYGWPVITWTEQQDPELTVVLPFILIGAFVALVTARAVNQRGRSFWVILSAAPFFTLCVLLNDTVPASEYLQMSLFALIMLLMTQTLRRKDTIQSNRLSAILTLPIAIALALMFHALPRDGYTPPPEDLAQQTVTWFQELELGEELVSQVMDFVTSRKASTVDLKNSGPRGSQKYKVMEVTAECGGALYLRGRAYDVYDGRQWQASEGEWALDGDFPTRSTFRGYVDIQTNTVHDVLYNPVVSTESIRDQFYAGFIPNPDKLKGYTFPWFLQYDGQFFTQTSYLLSADGTGVTDIQSGAEDLMWELAGQYLQLPEETREAAEAYLRENMPRLVEKSTVQPRRTMVTTHIAGKQFTLPINAAGDVMLEASIIRELVESSAAYDLKTRKMPLSESDFAMWFLKGSDTGYCVHFATAATVLLRAAGIPARYVEGYLVSAREDQTVTVRGEDAHAWVEYWVPGSGWLLLEATPGLDSGTATETTQTTGPEETTEETTLPAETEEETEPDTTPPDRPTRPDMTRPSIPGSEATDPTEGGIPLLPGGDGDGPVLDLSWLVTAAKWLAATVLALGTLWGQCKLRLTLRMRRLSQGSPNQRALRYWQVLQRLWKLLKTPPSPELEALALKARFSQYTLTEEELETFFTGYSDAIARLRGAGLLRQVLYRLALALY